MCWGEGNNGRLGDNAVTQRNTPQQVHGLLSGVTQISAGDAHTCALAHNIAQCWGRGGHGRLGNNAKENKQVPVVVDFSN